MSRPKYFALNFSSTVLCRKTRRPSSAPKTARHRLDTMSRVQPAMLIRCKHGDRLRLRIHAQDYDRHKTGCQSGLHPAPSSFFCPFLPNFSTVVVKVYTIPPSISNARTTNSGNPNLLRTRVITYEPAGDRRTYKLDFPP